MSRGVNKVILIGNLGQDPDIRNMPNGGAVANLTLATSESWRDKQTGEMKEKTEWHRVVIFGKLAEVAGEYLRKGSQVYIEGSHTRYISIVNKLFSYVFFPCFIRCALYPRPEGRGYKARFSD